MAEENVEPQPSVARLNNSRNLYIPRRKHGSAVRMRGAFRYRHLLSLPVFGIPKVDGHHDYSD